MCVVQAVKIPGVCMACCVLFCVGVVFCLIELYIGRRYNIYNK